MKLTFILTMVACLHVSAKTWSQNRITIHLQSAELKKALNIIEQKSDFRFLYNESLIAKTPKINIDFADADIKTILDKIIVENGLGYKIMSNNLIVLKEQNQEIRISGKVTGTGNIALAGVSVTIQGTNTGTTTDAQGNYTISVPNENTVLVFSYVGYGTQQVTVGNRTTIDITLVGTANQLDQVVVVGYGSQRKVDVTGAVDQVRGSDITKQPNANPISALQGRVAGVQITNNGQPGSSPEIRIRGVGTVYGNPNPLYVVDGVWYNDISFLNPNDIENISILKDASSESIYGIRAANGVVLITTKRGRSGKTNVNYNGFVGYQRATNQPKMANANQYATLINEKALFSGDTNRVLNPAQFGAGTNWYNVILRNALITKHDLSISGGSERTTFNLSIGYYDQQGIVKTNDYKRYNVRLQNDFQVFSALKLGYTVVGMHSKSQDINGSIFHQLYAAPPVLPVFYNDGTYGNPGDYGLGQTVQNPQATLDFYHQNSVTNTATGNVYADLKFLKHFTYHFSLGGEYGQTDVTNYTPVYNATSTQNNTISLLALTRSDTRNWILENTLTYNNRIGDHNITALIGQGAQSNRFNQLYASAQNVPDSSSAYLYLGLGNNRNVFDVDPTNTSNKAYPLYSTIASYFGRINYSFKNRYLINASLRADGSSKFFGSNRWGYFPSVGAGWVISDEPFMQDNGIFNSLKLRGSWGIVGNANVPLNLSILRVNQDPSLTAIFGGQPYVGASINSIVPPTTFWEKSAGTDVGLELSILKGIIYFQADYYNRKTQNAIFNIPILSSIGTSGGTIIGNQATFQNEGFEFTATLKNTIGKEFSYTINANLGINNNKVLSVTTGNNAIYAGGAGATSGSLTTRTIAGQPIGQFYGYKVIGIFQDSAQAANSTQAGTAKAGDFIYADMNKDGKIDGNDRVVLGNPNPKYTYGINTTFNYKQFDLTLDFQGVAKVDIYNANQGLRYGNENYTEDFFNNRWHGAGTSNTYPSANVGGNQNYQPNSWYVQDGSYFRIRNMQLGYTLPGSLISRWHMSNLRVYVNAQNAFNFFKYKGFSPEVGGTPTNAGIDVNVYPLFATYNFGINLGF